MSKKYDGEPLDMSWQTAPWNNDGETIDAHDSEGDGEIMTIDWPENATDREELTDSAQKLILTAARYPSVNNSKELLERSGLDNTETYPNQVLSEHWPERYWVGESNGDASIDNFRIEPEKIAKENVGEIRRRLLDGESLNQLVEEYQEGHERISRIVRGVADDIPDCDIPPLEWHNDAPQGWEIPDNSETDSEQDPETTRVTEDTETHSVTPDPVRHTPEPASSSLPAWVWAVVGAVFAWIVSKILG